MDNFNENDKDLNIEENNIKKSPKNNVRAKKRKHRSVSLTIILVTLILCCSIVLSIATIVFSIDIFGISGSNQISEIRIPEGSSVNQISQYLKEAQVIEWPFLFTSITSLGKNTNQLKAGFYEFKQNMSYSDIISTLKKGGKNDTDRIKIMFPEGITLYDAAQKLEENEVCDATEFLHQFNEIDIADLEFDDSVPKAGLKMYNFEGYFFPDTYEFYIGQNPASVARTIKLNFNTKIYSKFMSDIEKTEYTLDEILTFASIVQHEAPTYEDMQKVASVFWNRLNNSDKFPKLQSDPTRKYVREYIKKYADTQDEDRMLAYDTYQSDGLPPGAICNPGVEAIKAVLTPADTEYYYFCANIETKEIYYAKTLKEHEKNLKKAGIK